MLCLKFRMSNAPHTETPWQLRRSSIFLKNYVVMASIGVYDFEKNARQRVSIHIEVEIDVTSHRVRSDDLGAVVDYDFLRNGVAAIVASQHFELQETLCERLLDLCFSKSRVCAARVSTQKMDVYPDCDSVGVEQHARRL